MTQNDTDYTLSQALDESIKLWHEIVDTNETDKAFCIYKLREQGVLTKWYYASGCPLCHWHEFYAEDTREDSDCKHCPWPHYESLSDLHRCENVCSPYSRWARSRFLTGPQDLERRLTYAKEVLALLQRMAEDWLKGESHENVDA